MQLLPRARLVTIWIGQWVRRMPNAAAAQTAEAIDSFKNYMRQKCNFNIDGVRFHFPLPA